MSQLSRLTRNDIRDYVGSTYFQRGLHYFEQGRVLELKVAQADEEGVRLRARVSGQHQSSYRQSISIRWESFGASIDGDCDCPVGYNCKHVAAACLAFEHGQQQLLHPGGRDLDQLRHWLGRIVAAAEPQVSATTEQLIFILKPEDPDIQVEMRITRALKSGRGLSRGRPLSLSSAFNIESAPYQTEVDKDIIRLLRSASAQGWPMIPKLQGTLGRIALDRMLETGRCYWASHDGAPLVPGEARNLHLSWQLQSDGQLQLQLEAVPGGRLLLTDPPAYLDSEQGQVGPLDSGPLTMAQLEGLSQAPRLKPPQAEELSRLLLRDFPELPLPPPTQIEIREASELRVIPCLRLTMDPVSAVPRQAGKGPISIDVYCLELGFDYGEHRIDAVTAEAWTLVDTEKGLLRIQRDPEAEAAAIARLAEAGFGPSGEAPPLRLRPLGEGLVAHASRWSALLRETLPDLTDAGWRIELADDFDLHFEQGDWDASLDEEQVGGHDWFGLRFDLQVDGERLPLLPIVAPLLEQGLDRPLPEIVSVPIETGRGGNLKRFVDLPSERLAPVLETLRELFSDREQQPDGSMRLSRFDAPVLDDLASRGIRLQGGQRLRDLARQLRHLDKIERAEPPVGLTVALRPYQQHGLDWLQFLRVQALGGILADDMGLGKTVQTLSHILLEKESGRLDRPALVVAPTSLIGNWRREAARFTPALRVLVLHGKDRHQQFPDIADSDLVLTTYPLLPRDHRRLIDEEFHLLILDEAQTIKNPRAQAAQVARRLRARHRLCLTGTPMENHLGELWALFDFLLPGFLGDQRSFARFWRTPIEQQGDQERQRRLSSRVAPFLLRRRKLDVLTELPPKTEILRTVALGEDQAGLYEGIRLSMEKRVRDSIAAQGMARSQITILDALLKLRQICCDPRLLSLPAAQRVKHSAKLELLMDLLPEQLEEGRRILLFSQFTSMLALIEPELERRGIRYTKLTGATRHRDAVIDRFRGGEVDLFLISLKAGGLGLNLVEADTVILYDPWWNPAVESQAADRAHRIGQDKPVFVYKLLTEQTVEERILAMQQKKQALAEGLYEGRGGATGPLFTDADLKELFSPISE